jgi:hypothetical protein
LGEQVGLVGFHDEQVVGAAFLDQVGRVCALGVERVDGDDDAGEVDGVE